MLRFDAAIARYAVTQVSNGTMQQFLPWPREDEPEATPEAALALLKAMAKEKK